MLKKNKLDSPRIKEWKYEARRRSIKEGIFCSVRDSFGNHFLSPFAVAINMSNSLVALLSSIFGLLGPLTQMFSSRLIEKHERKKIILKAVFFESLMWIPLITIAILFYMGIIVNVLPLFFLLSFSLYVIFSNITSPSWFSWMGDIVSENYRGRWFSKRNLIVGFVTLVLAISASLFLDYFAKKGLIMFGFMILFFLAMVGRLFSCKTFKKMYEPKIKLKKGYYFSFWDFLIKAPKNNFGRFAIFNAFLGFATTISTSLLAIYLLRNLNFSYFHYMLVIFSGVLFSLTLMEFWGRFADKCGNYKVLVITSLLIPIIPILWILSPSLMYLVLVPSAFGGIAWAGFNLAAGDFIYDNVSQEKRGLAVSYFNMLGGVGIFFGAGLAALLIKFLTISSIKPIFLIFIIGGITRIIVVALLLPKIREIRKTKKVKPKAFRHMIFRQIKPTVSHEFHQIMSIKKYLFYK